MSRNREAVIVVAITSLGALLRILRIGAQSLWFDELLSVTLSRLPIQKVLASPASIDPPLYYVLLHAWMQVSSDDGFIRALSALAGIAAIPIVYLLANKLIGAPGARISALLFALAPLQLFYAQEARMYALFVFFAATAMWAFLAAVERGRTRDYIFWIATTVLAIYTHLFAGLLLLAFDADALVRWWKQRISLNAIVVSNIIIGVLLLPLAVVSIQKMTWLLPALWLAPPTLLHPLLTLHGFVFGYTLPPWANLLALFATVSIFAFLCVSSVAFIRRGSDHEQLQFLWLAIIIPIGLTWVVSQFRSVYLDRLFLPSSIALYILGAWGITKSNYRSIIRVFSAVALLLMLYADWNYFADADYSKPPLRQAVSYLSARRAPGEPVIHTSDSSFLAGRHYDGSSPHILLYDPADQWLIPELMEQLQVPYGTNAREILNGQRSFWLVVALDHIVEQQQARVSEFDTVYVRNETENVGGVWLYRYEVER